MATTALSTLCLLLLLCCSGAGASSSWGASRGGAARECFFDGKLQALEPRYKAQSEAGSVEYFRRFNEDDDRELTCAGVFAIRVVIDPKGLLLPRYSNTHGLAYILQGRGIIGYSFPGCQEETHHQQQQYGYGYAYGYGYEHQHPDEHHKIHRFEQGDVVAMPAAAQRWLYNDGDVPLVAVYVFDTNNNINQLDPDMRKFLLAGGFSKGQPHFAENILKGIDARFLSEALGVSMSVAEKLQSQQEQRGEIVRTELEHGLHLLIPPQDQHLHPYQHGQTCQRFAGGDSSNNICAMALRHSVERLDQADVYSPGAGRITRLTSNKFPILNLVQMSAVRVDLYQDAILSPFWNFNAHSAMYAIRGYARVQVATENGTTVFDGVLRPGKLLIIPQGYLVATKAQGEGFQYIAFETNHNSMVAHVAGKNSVLSDLPVGVIASSYGISMEEAAELKNSRKHELAVFTPGSTGTYSQGHVGMAQQ